MDLGPARPQLLENLEGHLQRSRADSLQHQTTHDFVQTTSRNNLAGQFSRFDAAALAQVDRERLPFADLVTHGHAVSAFATQGQALQQRRSLTCGAAPPVISVAPGIGPQGFLIRLILLPTDVARVRVGQKDFPLRPRKTPITMRAGDGNLRRSRATEDEGSGVTRIVKNPEHPMMRQRRTDYLPCSNTRNDSPWPTNSLRVEVSHYL
jgi:hypothetical protein